MAVAKWAWGRGAARFTAGTGAGPCVVPAQPRRAQPVPTPRRPRPLHACRQSACASEQGPREPGSYCAVNTGVTIQRGLPFPKKLAPTLVKGESRGERAVSPCSSEDVTGNPAWGHCSFQLYVAETSHLCQVREAWVHA